MPGESESFRRWLLRTISGSHAVAIASRETPSNDVRIGVCTPSPTLREVSCKLLNRACNILKPLVLGARRVHPPGEREVGVGRTCRPREEDGMENQPVGASRLDVYTHYGEDEATRRDSHRRAKRKGFHAT